MSNTHRRDESENIRLHVKGLCRREEDSKRVGHNGIRPVSLAHLANTELVAQFELLPDCP